VRASTCGRAIAKARHSLRLTRLRECEVRSRSEGRRRAPAVLDGSSDPFEPRPKAAAEHNHRRRIERLDRSKTSSDAKRQHAGCRLIEHLLGRNACANSIAFSPTDAMPLIRRARLLMAAGSAL